MQSELVAMNTGCLSHLLGLPPRSKLLLHLWGVAVTAYSAYTPVLLGVVGGDSLVLLRLVCLTGGWRTLGVGWGLFEVAGVFWLLEQPLLSLPLLKF